MLSFSLLSCRFTLLLGVHWPMVGWCYRVKLCRCIFKVLPSLEMSHSAANVFWLAPVVCQWCHICVTNLQMNVLSFMILLTVHTLMLSHYVSSCLMYQWTCLWWLISWDVYTFIFIIWVWLIILLFIKPFVIHFSETVLSSYLYCCSLILGFSFWYYILCNKDRSKSWCTTEGIDSFMKFEYWSCALEWILLYIHLG